MSAEPNFDQFFAQYRKLHPANIPVRQKAVSRYPDWLRGAVGGMFLAAGLISAVHTIPTVYGGIEANGVIPEWARILAAVLSPVAVELAILIAAYAFQRGSKIVVGLMLTVTFAVALVSNISSSIRALDAAQTAVVKTPDASATVVGIVLGIGLPLIALVAGILFSNIHEAQVEAERAADNQYQADCLTFDAAVRSAWDGHLARLEAQRAAAEERARQLEQARQAEDTRKEEERKAEERAERLRQERREASREQRERREQREQSTRSTRGTRGVHEPIHEPDGTPVARVNLREIAKQVHESGDERLSVEEMMLKYGISRGGTSKVRAFAAEMNGQSAPEGGE